MTGKRLTEEQAAVRDDFEDGANIVVQAGAGSGKTEVLVACAKSPKGRRRQGRYLAYNSAAAKAAKLRFPNTVTCSTIHGQAWHMARPYDERNRIPLPQGKGARRQYGWHIADILGIKRDVKIADILIQPRVFGRLVIETMDKWCHGIDPEFRPEHVPWQRHLSREGNAELRDYLLPLVQRAWFKEIMPLDGRINVKHDYYLRMWWNTGRARMRTSFIMLDEAQDANPLAAAIVQSQRHAQLVAVGDSFQSLYEWRGAVDALENWPADRTRYLRRSFRFGDAIADWANLPLRLMNAHMQVIGTPSIRSVVGPVEAPRAVLCRTNAGALSAAVEALAAGRRPKLASSASTIREFAEAAQKLQDGYRTDHADLFPFESWAAVLEYVDREEDAADLKMLVDLVEEHGAKDLVDLVDKLALVTNADVVMSTVHGAKGLEYESVQAGKDLYSPGRDGEGERRAISRSMGRLIYVLLTRPRLRLDPNNAGGEEEGLGWLPAWVADQEAREKAHLGGVFLD